MNVVLRMVLIEPVKDRALKQHCLCYDGSYVLPKCCKLIWANTNCCDSCTWWSCCKLPYSDTHDYKQVIMKVPFLSCNRWGPVVPHITPSACCAYSVWDITAMGTVSFCNLAKWVAPSTSTQESQLFCVTCFVFIVWTCMSCFLYDVSHTSRCRMLLSRSQGCSSVGWQLRHSTSYPWNSGPSREHSPLFNRQACNRLHAKQILFLA